MLFFTLINVVVTADQKNVMKSLKDELLLLHWSVIRGRRLTDAQRNPFNRREQEKVTLIFTKEFSSTREKPEPRAPAAAHIQIDKDTPFGQEKRSIPFHRGGMQTRASGGKNDKRERSLYHVKEKNYMRWWWWVWIEVKTLLANHVFHRFDLTLNLNFNSCLIGLSCRPAKSIFSRLWKVQIVQRMICKATRQAER